VGVVASEGQGHLFPKQSIWPSRSGAFSFFSAHLVKAAVRKVRLAPRHSASSGSVIRRPMSRTKLRRFGLNRNNSAPTKSPELPRRKKRRICGCKCGRIFVPEKPGRRGNEFWDAGRKQAPKYRRQKEWVERSQRTKNHEAIFLRSVFAIGFPLAG